MSTRITLALDCATLESEAVVKLWQTEFYAECSRQPFIDGDIPNKFWLKVMTDYRRIRDLIAEGYTVFSATGWAVVGTRDVYIVSVEDLNSQPQRFQKVVRAAPGGIELTLEFDQFMFDWLSQWMSAMGIRDITQFMDLAIANGLVFYGLKKARYCSITARNCNGHVRPVQLVTPDDFRPQLQKVRLERTFEGDIIPVS